MFPCSLTLCLYCAWNVLNEIENELASTTLECVTRDKIRISRFL
jgi:hypothetical protein